MLGLGLGFGKLSSYKYTVKKLIDDYIKRVTAAGGYLEGNECATAKVRELNSQRLLDDASWLLIPEGIKEDVVYAQKPTNGLGDLVFTRASDATRTNSAGVIERTPWNLVTFSEMFSDVAWTKLNSTISANTTIAPNGTLTADTITANVGTPISCNIDFATATGTGNFTASIFAKKGSVDWLYIRQGNSGGGTSVVRAWFNLNTGTIGSTSPAAISHSIEDYGNGWYRCSMTFSVLSGGFPRPQFYLSTGDGVTTLNSDGSQFFYLWGAQLVEGTDAKPYFATTNRQDVPRLDYRNADGTLNSCPRLLLEPQRTNSIRNSTMVGAVAGSPGTLPTNWGIVNSLTQTIVAIGTENGLQYMDVRFNGTSGGTTILLNLESSSQIAASNGQTWTNSFYFKSIAAPTPPNSYNLLTIQRLSGVAGASFTQPFTATSTLARYTQTVTTNNPSITHIQPYLQIGLTNGATYDFTIRIAAPQMDLGAYATTFIPTTTAAVTRLVDNFTRNNLFTNNIVTASGGTWFVDLSSNLSYTRDASAVGVFLSSSSTGAGVGSYTFGISTINTTARLAIAKRENGVFSALYTTLVDSIKIAIKWNGTTADVFVNGVKVVTATSFTSAALEFLNTSNLDVPKFINQMALFPVPMTDAQCIQLTT